MGVKRLVVFAVESLVWGLMGYILGMSVKDGMLGMILILLMLAGCSKWLFVFGYLSSPAGLQRSWVWGVSAASGALVFFLECWNRSAAVLAVLVGVSIMTRGIFSEVLFANTPAETTDTIQDP